MHLHSLDIDSKEGRERGKMREAISKKILLTVDSTTREL